MALIRRSSRVFELMQSRLIAMASLPVFALAFVPRARAASPEILAGSPQPWAGQPGIHQTVEDIMLREKLGSTRHRMRETHPEFEMEPRPSKSPLNRVRKTKAARVKSATSPSTQASVTTGTSFDAARYADSGSVPPDSMGDIGPTQFLLCLNGRIRTFNRAGNLDGALDTTTANFFDSVRGNGDTADPRVRYDKLSGRWFISMLSYATPTRILIAVSSGPVIAAGTSFTFFQFGHSEVGPTPNSDTGSFFDFDTLGVDRLALYIGGDVFNPSGPFYVGSTGFVVNKADLLAGTLSVTAFRQMASSAGGGPYAPQGVDNDDLNASEGYFIGRDILSSNHLIVRRISNPGGLPAISDNIALTIPSTAQPKGGVLALGSSFPLEDLDDRLFQARMRQGHLVTGHNIEVDAAGTAGSGGGRDGVRWYDIVNLSGIPALAQSGTLFDSAATNPRSYWMPSSAMSGQGHLAVAGNVASTTQYPQIAAALRLVTDAPGAIGSPAIVQSATANSNDLTNQFNQHRWGDYSTLSVDPNDDMTFWTVQEYSTAPDSWAVRVIQLKAPPPATPVSATPSSIVQGQFDTDIVVTGTSQNGSGFFDPGATFPNRLGALVNGGGVTLNRITYSDPTHLTINVTVSTTATLGSRTITITNPDSQSLTSAAGLLTVNSSIDTDSDGIPDWWTQKYFGHATGQAADRSRANDEADGDGFTNLQEFRAHTDPRNPLSALRVTVVQRGADGTHITFMSVAGKSYRLEAKDSLTSPTWTTVADNIPGLAGTTMVIDPNVTGLAQQFYRVLAID